jgi:sulfatase modifying factor 1
MSNRKLFCLALGISLLTLFSGCDDKTTGDPVPDNSAPNQPSNPVPANQATGQFTDVNLAWTCSDPDGDPLTYDVYFGTASTPPQVSTGQSGASYDPGTLSNNQTYYWRVVAHDDQGHETLGLTWSFRTPSGGSTEGMVLVPAGPFSMGADYEPLYSLPIHTVNLPAFYMDIYEVTNERYKAFCDATSREYPGDPGFDDMPNYFTNSSFANYPVVNVSWDDAQAYAAWAGKRLPTEAEWERAAKGSTDNRQWPWGDSWVDANSNVYDNPVDGYTTTSPVGAYPSGISPVGCYDMAGNVWEWCEDDWHEDYNGAPSDGSAWIESPRGLARVQRGGAWGSDAVNAQCAWRLYDDPLDRSYGQGFRCARTP